MNGYAEDQGGHAMLSEGVRMTFREYYGAPFVEDVNTFRAWVAASRLSHREDLDGVFAIQPHLIEEHAHEIAKWGSERVALFATALFFTVLVDQVCYTHFHHAYSEFQHLTRYPKLCGLCPGGCQNRYPTDVFSWLAECFPSGRSELYGAYEHTVSDAVPVMKEEVLSFFSRYVRTIDPTQFWGWCERHLPRNEGGQSDAK